MWERFSFFGIYYTLITFLSSPPAEGGWGWAGSVVYTLFGLHGLLVYLAGIPFGQLADRYIGRRNAILLGCMALCLGHALFLFLDSTACLLAALGCLIVGTGLIKGNISTLVGELYSKGDPKKEKGFAIFYMGINLGILLAAVTVTWVCREVGWSYGLALPGAGVLSGLTALFLAGEHLPAEQPLVRKRVCAVYFLGGAGLLYLIGYGVVRTSLGGALIAWGRKNYLFLSHTLVGVLVLAIIGLLLYLIKSSAHRIEKRRMIAFAISVLPVLCFFIGYKQSSGSVLAYARQNTAPLRILGMTIPKMVLQSLGPIFTIMLSVPMNSFWGRVKKRFSFVNATYKMAVGLLFLGISFAFLLGAQIQQAQTDSGHFSLFWLVGTYFFLTLGELSLMPVALSFASNMAPRQKGGLLLGVEFAAIGVGTYLASQMGSLSHSQGSKLVFQVSCAGPILLGLLFLLINPLVRRLAHEDFRHFLGRARYRRRARPLPKQQGEPRTS
jgi:POT family proton-dependent oligopeptide transporter